MERHRVDPSRRAARSALAACLVTVTGLAACGDADDGGGGYGNSSPTGTFLTPAGGLDGRGYRVLDEACEEVDDPAYLERFETPMFRGVAVRDDVAFLVDGSLLWAVDVADATAPRRLSLLRLPGHPLRAALTEDGTLLVAAGEAGLVAVDVTDATAPRVTATVPLPGPALDVAVRDDKAYVAAGRAGLLVVDLGRAGGPALAGKAELPGFAVAVALEEKRAYVAACQTLVVIDVSVPEGPTVLGAVWVPLGHAKDVAVDQGQVFLAGGEALLAYDAREATAIEWKGWYEEPEVEGFYVNGVVTRDGVAYLAAGDESVRAVDVADLQSRQGVPAQLVQSAEPPALDGPEVLPDPEIETVAVVPHDPIGVALHGDRLLVLGNFRWVGERTLRLMDVSARDALVDLGAYVQPADPAGVSQHGARLLVHGVDGEARVLPPTEDASFLSLGASVVRAVERPEGLYLLTEAGAVLRWSAETPSAAEVLVEEGQPLTDLAVGETLLVAASRDARGLVSAALPGAPGEPAWPLSSLSLDEAFLGEARLLWHLGRLYAYDWVLGVLRTFEVTIHAGIVPVAAFRVGLCEAYDLADRYSGRQEVQARLIGEGRVLHLFCPEDEEGRGSMIALRLDGNGVPRLEARTDLPDRRYVDVLVKGGRATTLAFDNGRYRTTLSYPAGKARQTLSWDGHGTGLLVHLGALLVADGDLGLLGLRPSAGGDVMVAWPEVAPEVQP